MMKKIMVLAGMAAMLLCGCGKTEEIKTEQDVIVERAIETSENIVDDIATEIANWYVMAIYEEFGEDLVEAELSYDEWGVYYRGIYNISWNALDQIAHELMMEEE